MMRTAKEAEFILQLQLLGVLYFDDFAGESPYKHLHDAMENAPKGTVVYRGKTGDYFVMTDGIITAARLDTHAALTMVNVELDKQTHN